MGISAQRFSILDQQTNVAVTDIGSYNGKSLLNSSMNDLKSISDSVKNFINTNVPNISSNIADMQASVGDALDQAKSAQQDIINQANEAKSLAEDKANELIGDTKDSITSLASDAASGISDTVGTATTQLTSFAGSTSGSLLGSDASSLTDSVSGYWSDIQSVTSSAYGQMSNGLLPRITKDGYSSLLPNAPTSSSDLSSLIKSLVGSGYNSDPSILNGIYNTNNMSSALTGLGRGCQSMLAKGFGSSRYKPPMVNCGGSGYPRYVNTGSCNPNSLANALGAYYGNGYNYNIVDSYNLENLSSLLSTAGYSNGLCGIFSGVVNKVQDPNMISRIAANVLTNVSGNNDMLSVVDIGRSLLSGNVVGVTPAISSVIMSQFKTPNEIANRDLSGFYNNFSNGMYNIDNNWVSGNNGYLDVSNLGGASSGSFSDINDMLIADASNVNIATEYFGNIPDAPDSAYLQNANSFDLNDYFSFSDDEMYI